MKEYVQRCFTACETEEDKDRTEKVLKEVLQERLKDGSAYTIDWTREPLPEWVQFWLWILKLLVEANYCQEDVCFIFFLVLTSLVS